MMASSNFIVEVTQQDIKEVSFLTLLDKFALPNKENFDSFFVNTEEPVTYGAGWVPEFEEIGVYCLPQQMVIL